MKCPLWLSRSAIWYALCGAAMFVRNAGAEDFVAVFSSVSNGYERTKLPDGSFGRETYTFKEGGFLGSRISDDSIDKMEFKSIARTIADSLAAKNYVPSVNPKAARLLIVVYWGTSRAPGETSKATPISEVSDNTSPNFPLPGLDSHGRPLPRGIVPFREGLSAGDALAFGNNMINEEDAMMLGYGSAAAPDLKEYRYFIVLLAYDLQAFLREGKQTLYWQARFSMGEHRNQFDLQLKAMVQTASAYFGRDSVGLKHDPVPTGRVIIGEVKSLDTLAPSDCAALSPDGVHVAYLKADQPARRLAIVDIDNPEIIAVTKYPSLGAVVRVRWTDSEHVVVTLPSSQSVTFDLDGMQAGAGDPGTESDLSSLSASFRTEIQTLAERKFPHRTVSIINADGRLRRFLLAISNGEGPARFYVFDRNDDLLFEVGRETASP